MLENYKKRADSPSTLQKFKKLENFYKFKNGLLPRIGVVFGQPVRPVNEKHNSVSFQTNLKPRYNMAFLILFFKGWSLAEVIKWLFNRFLGALAIDTLKKYRDHYARTIHAFLVKDLHFPESSVPSVDDFKKMIDALIKQLSSDTALVKSYKEQSDKLDALVIASIKDADINIQAV